ncbi:sensor histidine kinase [Muricoccus aerilatus]|uniref:sensor histidine kinase n=1 Tax=Muricoccus aerilatus TaxID=452982 RepID=UPI000694EC54|nr:HWE histidine kinase domain-containing protein [Roseomonas aerilata]
MEAPIIQLDGWPPNLLGAFAITRSLAFPALLAGRGLNLLAMSPPLYRLLAPDPGGTPFPAPFAAALARALDGETVLLPESFLPLPARAEDRFDISLGPLWDEAGAVLAAFVLFLPAGSASAPPPEDSAFRAVAEGIPLLVWRALPDGRWSWAGPQWTRFTGQTETESLGEGWLAPVHPEDRPAALRAWEEAATAGRLEVELRIRRAADGRHAWHVIRAAPLYDEAGALAEWIGTTTDIHEMKQRQQLQDLVVAELQHRTRNLLALVRSLARKTLSASSSTENFERDFHRRLDALARAQALASRSRAGHAAFDQILAAELSAHAHGRIAQVETGGPSGIMLGANAVQILALVLHELATNAVKHGALGQHGAHLAIRWRLHAQGTRAPPAEPEAAYLKVEWRESGVRMPQDPAPSRGSGYGRELIERALPYQLGACTSFTLGPDGVRCTIELPVLSHAAEPA